MSLLEILIVIALIGIMVAFGIPALYRFFQDYRVKTAATQIGTQIRLARNNCVSQKIQYRVIINNKNATTNRNTYTVQNNKSGSFLPVDYLDFDLPGGINIENSAVFIGGVATITMDTRGGVSALAGSPPFFIDIKGITGLTYRITVQLTGAVKVEKV